MKILLTGSRGQTGWELIRAGRKQGLEIIGLDIDELDITDRPAVAKIVNQKEISLVINTAAYTAVDKAELEPDSAFAANKDGPLNLALACAESRIPLIHISTDYVFDGNKKSPYMETDPTSAMGVYGKSKEAGEKAIRSSLQQHIIIRTAWLYGVHGQNFVKTMLKIGCNMEKIRVVDDQFGCPTFARDLADTILTIAAHILNKKRIKWGTYHFCGSGVTTWYGFAKKIFEFAKVYKPLTVKTIEPITTNDYPTPARRPPYSVLDCTNICKNFSVMQPAWEQSLKTMLKETLNL